MPRFYRYVWRPPSKHTQTHTYTLAQYAVVVAGFRDVGISGFRTAHILRLGLRFFHICAFHQRGTWQAARAATDCGAEAQWLCSKNHHVFVKLCFAAMLEAAGRRTATGRASEHVTKALPPYILVFSYPIG